HRPCSRRILRHGSEAPAPAVPPEPLPADLRRGRDLPGAPAPLERGEPDPRLVDALPRRGGDAPPLQGEGVRLPRPPPPPRGRAARLRGVRGARDRLHVLLVHPMADASPVAPPGVSG